MRYHLTIDFYDKKRVAQTRSTAFSEDRWLAARVQALTVLGDCYSENHKLLGLYLDKIERRHIVTGTWHPVPTLRAVLVDFDKPIFDQNVSFVQLKQNLKRERDLYTLFSKHKVLSEQVHMNKENSIELIKGSKKLLSCYFK